MTLQAIHHRSVYMFFSEEKNKLLADLREDLSRKSADLHRTKIEVDTPVTISYFFFRNL